MLSSMITMIMVGGGCLAPAMNPFVQEHGKNMKQFGHRFQNVSKTIPII